MASAGDSLLALKGRRVTGQSIRSQNVTAAVAIANVVKSSLGPVGLDKMLVDDVGDVTITNDGATILKLLEVEHPAAKILVELAQLQDQEVGDGTTSVVIIAAELLKAADELVKQKIHPTNVINGYRLACKEAVRYMQDNLSFSVEELDKENIIMAAKTSMSSKLIGPESDFFAAMCVEAATLVKVVDGGGKMLFPIKAVNILKAHGKSSKESRLINGYALNCTRASDAMPRKIMNPKIACLDFSLQKAKMHLGISVVVEDPAKLEAIRREEMDITSLKLPALPSLHPWLHWKDEQFETSLLGSAEEVVQERISDDELILIKGPKARTAASIILRGANDVMLDEMERSMHDALCVVRRVLESKKVVVGGGAVEAALNVYLESFATSLASREQLAVAEFANALLVIPKTLASNAAKDATHRIRFATFEMGWSGSGTGRSPRSQGGRSVRAIDEQGQESEICY
uniref:T-complex protein 1 subunit alpha n=1 Tax=Ditylenchus dipsaci TaxID=166011 RepID=A0A915EB52_9BILA